MSNEATELLGQLSAPDRLDIREVRKMYEIPPVLTIAQWRQIYADLSSNVSFSEIWGREDEPDFDALRPLGGVGVLGQVKIIRDSGGLRKVPAWMNNEEAIRLLLMVHFPKLLTDEGQRRTAAKWHFLIQRFRVLDSAQDIARQWNALPNDISSEEDRVLDQLFEGRLLFRPRLDAAQVRSTIQKILNVAAGLRTDGKSLNGKRGRPKSVRK